MRSCNGEAAHVLSVADAAAAIRAAVERVPGLHLERIAEAGGRYSAVFEVRPNPTYSKWLATAWHAQLDDMLSCVLDTLEHLDKEIPIPMNVFSAAMFEYLCAEMLPTDGRPVALTVKGVTEEKIVGPRGDQVKLVMSFKERPKKLVLNKTNVRALAKILGPETDNWPGASVTLGVEPIKVGRETVPSIRVKSATAAQRQGPGRSTTPSNAPAFSDAGTIPTAERQAQLLGTAEQPN